MSQEPQWMEESESDAVPDQQPVHADPERARMTADIREYEKSLEQAYKRLLLKARAGLAPLHPSRLESRKEWDAVVLKGAADFRSGMALMDQLGADALINAETAGMLLAMRIDLVEETHATSAADFMLIDMAVIAHANAMRVQTMIGNMALLIEAEAFGQKSVNALWRKAEGRWNERIKGLMLEEYLRRLSNDMLPLVERLQRTAQRHIEALTRRRNEPAAHLENLAPLTITIMPITSEK